MLTKQRKTKIIASNKRHDGDTGSPEVQIALLSKRIDEVSKHLVEHRQDRHSRRGLLGMVHKRKKLMGYLEKKNQKVHTEVKAAMKTKKVAAKVSKKKSA